MLIGATIGCFDGAHTGHQYLLQQLRALTEARGMSSLAITFSAHPAVILGRTAPPQLCTLEDKQHWLAEGVERVEVLDFTKSLAALTAKDFMQYLRDKYNVRLLLLGYDHRFGRPQPDDDYERFGRELGIEIHRAEPLYLTSDPTVAVSSTAIRQALLEGRLAEAQQMLGRPYSIVGEVVHGFKVGRTLGFPTANISTPLLLPAAGVYSARVKIGVSSAATEGLQSMKAVLNIGHRPTVGNGSDLSVEVHIPGFSGDLYGQRLCITLERRLREERTFPSLDALRQQINLDIQSL